MLRRTARRDRMIGLFVAGMVLLNPPILDLVGGMVSGWPVMFLYLFGVWALLIAGVAMAVHGGGAPPEAPDRSRDGR